MKGVSSTNGATTDRRTL